MLRFLFLFLYITALTGFGFTRITDSTMLQSRAQGNTKHSYSLPSTTLPAYKNGGSAIQAGRTLSTNEILNPNIYLGQSPLLKSEDEPVPLFVGLRLLIRAVTDIIEADPTSHAAILSHLDMTSILRIEQPIASVHATDPLCWIHAQQRSLNQLRRILKTNPVTNSSSDNALPLIYFRDAEGQVEAVALGRASPAYSDSWDPFEGKRIWDTGLNKEYCGVKDEVEHHIPHMFKERELPPRARIYGGSRFDGEKYHQKMKSRRGKLEERDDWDEFGGDRGGYWILPTVELRREIVDGGTIDHDDHELTDGDRKHGSETRRVTMAVHLHNLAPTSSVNHYRQGWRDAASRVVTLLQALTDEISPPVACTTLPPVISRSETTKEGGDDADSLLAFERGVTEALRQIQLNGDGDEETLRKVVLARKVELNFDHAMSGMDVLMRMKFGGHIGHLFYMNPGDDQGQSARSEGCTQSREFLGCTPERLFRVNRSGHDRIVTSEALAGTRIRGLTPSADSELLRELLSSKKDILENEITGQFISNALNDLKINGWLEKNEDLETKSHQQRYFVRRLRHLQHICQTFQGKLSNSASVIDVSRSLLKGLHPTPAVCGDSPKLALEFIRKYESFGFDRGYYAGPFGYIGHDSADIVVAIRSALVTNFCRNDFSGDGLYLMQQQPKSRKNKLENGSPVSKVSIFGGAGIVEGSNVQGEWTEISHKIDVIASLFPSSPVTLQSLSSPNVAWSTAFIEELVRCGITQFYICPGSRNTPLTSAIFKSMRSNAGVVRAISVHDERGAGFRAVGFARQSHRPAVVVTSSGTAVANLYPSVVEASSDGVPLLILTADRPYENRDTGCNQSIDQVKIFSPTYVRWFRDILPPSDDVPVSLALSDANHAVVISKQLLGPVHLNIQFRENLAPESGTIRNDNRIGSTTMFNNLRFTDAPGFSNWSRSGRPWQEAFYPSIVGGQSILDVAELIIQSRRGIIVTGNLRDTQCNNDGTDSLSATISHFAKVIGFPILAGIQSGALRRELPVVPFSEYLLKNPLVSSGIKPDLVLQFGAPLISSEISHAIKSNPNVKHVLVQKLSLHERADPDQTVTYRISSDVRSFLNGMIDHLNRRYFDGKVNYGSELTPLLYLGRELQKRMPHIILQSKGMQTDESVTLTEPQVMLAISEVLSETTSEQSPMSLFLSNSMPVRDGEFFFYPAILNRISFPLSISVNRGASGIDGILSTATGCADNSKPTTLICGDVSTLHDLNALYGLSQDGNNDSQSASAFNQIRLSTVIVNNGGGAIFSFLPIAKFGQDVGFEEYWGTPTKNFSFQQGASAFGLNYKYASTFEAFKDAYRASIQSGGSTIVEAKVVGRATNVDIHQHITRETVSLVDGVLDRPPSRDRVLPVKWYNRSPSTEAKTLLLLHGWMGDNSEWDSVGSILSRNLPAEWNIISIDLPGHGNSSIILSSDRDVADSSLDIDTQLSSPQNSPFSLDAMARAVCHSLMFDHGVTELDAIAGYSLGGRIALAMKRLCSSSLIIQDNDFEGIPDSNLVTDQTRMILLGSNPGNLPNAFHSSADDFQRLSRDHSLTESLFSSSLRSFLVTGSEDELALTHFVTKWYGTKSLWGDLGRRHPTKYQKMIKKRVKSLVRRRRDIASVLYGCSPPNTSQDDWKAAVPSKTIFVAGALDKIYSNVGRAWKNTRGIARYIELDNVGHALLVEVPEKISSIVMGFVTSVTTSTERLEYAAGSWQSGVSTTDSFQASTPLKGKAMNIIVPTKQHQVGVLEYEAFSINIGSSDGSSAGVRGIGWGDSAQLGNELKRREGLIISITSRDGMAVGVGEVAPLTGLHNETIQEAEIQVKMIKEVLSSGTREGPEFDAARVLSLDGSLTDCVDRIFGLAGITTLSAAASVRAGLEMALLSMSSQLHGTLLPQALYFNKWRTAQSFSQLPINGLITKGTSLQRVDERGDAITFQSLKVKVGQDDSAKDALHLIRLKESSLNSSNLRLRADANRAWNVSTATKFVDELRNAAKLGDFDLKAFEFIEEPIAMQIVNGVWSFRAQINALETAAGGGSIKYALDESLADLVTFHGRNFDSIARDLRNVLGGVNAGHTNCAAFVLKPALLGLELSVQLARLAQDELQICPVFSSSFDSGIGLAFTAILAAVSDNSPSALGRERYSHGLGTFDMLGGDTLSPPFESYVNKNGILNVPSLSRALYGLSLDEMSDRLPVYEATTRLEGAGIAAIPSLESDSYLASTSSMSGRDITVSVSLPLPFSDRIASSRFTDLPQMSRWSPWLNSVTYLDESPGLTEWNLSIRGVKFRWRAKSEVLSDPKGIKWESISGLKNRGVVEFEPTSDTSCTMKLKMSIIMPHILVSLFQGMPSVVQHFLQNKLLKWSLEMFRDVVKADLALERGDQELGDALFGAVEGRANALEEAMK
jgi:2-succinyl-5-enolpyruvyl-6-hydroxy-3-cyclohexene-1-carboxylate synthase